MSSISPTPSSQTWAKPLPLSPGDGGGLVRSESYQQCVFSAWLLSHLSDLLLSAGSKNDKDLTPWLGVFSKTLKCLAEA